MKNRFNIIISRTGVIILLVLLAIITRFAFINHYPLWADEYLTANATIQPSFSNLLEVIYENESIPPLSFILDKLIVSIFGVSEFSLRFLSSLFGALAILVYYKIFNSFADRRTTIFATLMFIFSGFYIFYSNSGRVYSLQILLGISALYNLIRYLNTKSRASFTFLALFLFLAVQVHYYSALLAFAIIITFYIFTKDWKKFITLAITVGISGLTIVPHFIQQMALQTQAGSKAVLIKHAAVAIAYIPVKTLLGPALHKLNSPHPIFVMDIIALIVLGIIIVLVLLSIGISFKKNFIKKNTTLNYILTFMVISYIFHIVLGFKFPALHPRYTAYALCFLIGLLAYFTRYQKWLQIIVVVLYIGINIVGFTSNYLNKSLPYRRPWKKIVTCIDSISNGKPQTIISNNRGVSPVTYYSNLAHSYLEIPRHLYSDIGLKKGEPRHFMKTDIEMFGEVEKDSSEFTIEEVVSSIDSGIYVHVDIYAPYGLDFLEHFSEDIHFTVISEFPSNQGSVYIVSWQNIISNKVEKNEN